MKYLKIIVFLSIFLIFYQARAQFVESNPTVTENQAGSEEIIIQGNQTLNFFLDFMIFLVVILVGISLITLVASIVSMFSAGGDEGTLQNGYRLLRLALLGLLISVIVYIVANAVKYFF